MMKGKIVSALIAVAIAAPLMTVTTSANAYHKAYRDGCRYYHHCYRCYSGCYYGPRNMGLVYKVVKRLRADGATYDQPIYVSARGHEVTLSGYTGTAMQKQTAIDIARYTCGVWLVIDNLRIQMP